MRGRKPHRLSLAAADRNIFDPVSRSRTLSWFQVQRARALLAMAAGERIQILAWQLQCSPTTLWRLVRRYKRAGLAGALLEAPRSGRPTQISPPATGADRAAGLSGADR